MKACDGETDARWVRLSDACARLIDAGIGTAHLAAAIGTAGMASHIVATGFQSVVSGGRREQSVKSARVRRMFWRVLCSAKADDEGFVRVIREERITWHRDQGDAIQESWDAVLFDQPRFGLFLADVKARRAGAVQQLHEVAAWIQSHAGRNSKVAWQGYKRELGRRAVTQATFEEIWRHERDHPTRGAPKKS